MDFTNEKTVAYALEAILFVAGEAVGVTQLAQAVQQDVAVVRSAIAELSNQYRDEQRGIQIIEVNDSFQMCTNSLYYETIREVYKNPVKRALTPALLETLAIITYKQPVTKHQIEDIRGVNSDHVVNKLIEYHLVEEKGRLDTPGKPIVFGTSDDFLRYFGFRSLDELPEPKLDLEKAREEAQKEVDDALR